MALPERVWGEISGKVKGSAICAQGQGRTDRQSLLFRSPF